MYWNHTGLGQAVLKRLAKSTEKMPKLLKDISQRIEFWEYISRGERRTRPAKDLLPIQSIDNRALYIRLAAFGIIGMAKEEDLELLTKLTTHSYSLIARAAAGRIVNLVGQDALSALSNGIDESLQIGRAESLAEALRFGEMELFSIIDS